MKIIDVEIVYRDLQDDPSRDTIIERTLERFKDLTLGNIEATLSSVHYDLDKLVTDVTVTARFYE